MVVKYNKEKDELFVRFVDRISPVEYQVRSSNYDIISHYDFYTGKLTYFIVYNFSNRNEKIIIEDQVEKELRIKEIV